MSTIVPTPVPALGTELPDPSDRTTYGTRGRALWDWEVNTLVPAINQLGDTAYANALQSQESALVAVAAANFKGSWASLSGALAVPAAVWHSGRVWALMVGLSNVAASEPGVSGDWVDVGGVKRSGDILTGHLSTVAGASGNQVPRRSEVVGISGTETITGVKTFSVAPIVPSNPTGNQPTPANQTFGFGQLKTAVARANGTTYTNNTGKPITLIVRSVTASVTDTLSITIDGERSAIASYSAASGATIAVNSVIPVGSIYVVAWTGMVSTAAFEYR